LTAHSIKEEDPVIDRQETAEFAEDNDDYISIEHLPKTTKAADSKKIEFN
jgi:hypothetical protein